MPASITFKRGSTFSFGCPVQLPAGTWTASAQLRSSTGKLVQQLTVTLTPPVAPATTHQLLLTATALQSKTWPLGEVSGDVRFTDSNGLVIPTSSFTLLTQDPVTTP